MENSAHGLTLLEPDHKVVVTGEEHHQPALAGYAPRADGRSRRVAVELGLVAARRGGRVIEVRLDGRRVGQLTPLMSQRYGPLVDDVRRRGGRPGAVALVIDGRRGVEVELRLPDVPAGAPAPAPLPPAPRPPAPRPPSPGPDGGRPAGRRRGRVPLLVGGGVLALLLGIGAAVGGGEDESATTAATPRPTVNAVSPSTAPPTTTSTPTTSTPTTSVTPDLDEADLGEAAAPVRIPPAAATRTATADPEPQQAVAAPVEPEPEPEPERAVEPEPAAVSYRNCDAVRAAGAAPIRRGDPGYSSKLDRDGDGVGCEN